MNLNGEKVVLTAINAKYIHSNLAVYSLRANAGEYSDQVGIVEYTINHRKEEILQAIYRCSPEVVGFSCYIWNIRYVLDIAADLKAIHPEVIIILGGPEVSYDAPRVLEQNPFVDMIIQGEGERTFRRFLECYLNGDDAGGGEDYGSIPGLCVRTGGKVRTAVPAQAMDMDDLVFPYHAAEGMDNRIFYYETMRGCPFSCSYCLSSIEKGVRFRSLPRVYEEIQFFLDHRARQVKFVDRTFNCNHKHAYKIWEYIWKNDNGVTNFHFEIGGDLLREEDFALFEKFRPGLVQFEIGIQSTNSKTIQEIQRRMDLPLLAKNLSRVRQTRRIHQHVDLIAGLPYEDLASFRRSFNEVYAMEPDQLQLGFLKILKGSYMEEKKAEYAIAHGNQPPYEVLATRWLSFDDILLLKWVEEMVEIYYNSFQFQATMALLGQCHDDAFTMFERLGTYYDENGYFEREHTRISRYEILWDYINTYFAEQAEEFRQTLTYDLYLRDYVKNPPSFVRKRKPEYVEAVRSFLDGQAKKPDKLTGYDGFTSKQLFHMVYVDEFVLDLEYLMERNKIRKVSPYSLVFDYRRRNPLNNSARVIPLDAGWSAVDG